MLCPFLSRWLVPALSLLVLSTSAKCDDWLVASSAELRAALAGAADGDAILLAPGNYDGGLFRAGLRGVTIRSQQAQNPAVIEGGTNGLQLSDATDVTIASLVFQGASANGLNIDDGGSFATPSSHITLRDVEVRDVGSAGNHDGIKLSGVNDFLLEGVRVFDWGSGGSAVDMVGSHRGVIQNSLFRSDVLSDFGTGIRPKGGSRDIVIRANRLEFPLGQGRAVQAGGSTGAQFFRFLDGESGYEAAAIEAYGNVVLGAASAFSYVNIDGGDFHHNYIERPRRWVARILNENQGNELVDTRNGLFTDNRVVFLDDGNEFSTAVNVGPETAPETFTFARNQWLNLASPDPAGSTPSLPVAESDGIYGVDPLVDPDRAIRWAFPWGEWIVQAGDVTDSVAVAQPDDFLRAVPLAGAEFEPRASNPFVGNWQFMSLDETAVQLAPFTTAALLLRSCFESTDCGPLPLRADFNADGMVDPADFAIWDAGYGQTQGASASDGDADSDGDVDGHDYLEFQATFGEATLAAAVPEPSVLATLWIISLAIVWPRRLARLTVI